MEDTSSCSVPAGFLDFKQGLQQLKTVFLQHFSTNEAEISQALDSKLHKNFSYKDRLVFGVKAGSEVMGGAICIKRKIKNRQTLEIIWFATNSSNQGNGFGTILFNHILDFAKEQKINAVLATSTNRATSWWISRGFQKCASSSSKAVVSRNLLRSVSRPDLRSVSVSMDEAENHLNLKRLESLIEEHDLKFSSVPMLSEMESLYSDKVNRKRKGRILTSQLFKGAPYRYNVSKSNHIWFLISKDLIRRLGVRVSVNE